MEAAARGHAAAVGTLCGFGADPLVLSSTSSNALSLAAGQGHTEAVAMLLSLGGLLPRSVGAAAAALRAVATRLQALTPLRLTAARKERALWSLARRVDAAAEKTAATEKSSARRSRIAEKRARQGQMGRVGLMWGGRGLLKAVFVCWNSAAVAAISERAASRAATFRGESDHLANAQEFLLVSTAAVRTEVDEAIDALVAAIAAASSKVGLAASRASLVVSMLAHCDEDNLTPLCRAVMSGHLDTVQVMATCWGAFDAAGAGGLAFHAAYAQQNKAFSAFRLLCTVEHRCAAASEAVRVPSPFPEGVLRLMRAAGYGLTEEDLDAAAEEGYEKEDDKAMRAVRTPQSRERGDGPSPRAAGWRKAWAAQSESPSAQANGTGWGVWLAESADVHQLQSRCASASQALTAVGEIAKAAVAVWVLEEGPAKTRAEAKERHCRKLHRELAAKQLIGWGQEE